MVAFSFFGSPSWTRTKDPLINSVAEWGTSKFKFAVI